MPGDAMMKRYVEFRVMFKEGNTTVNMFIILTIFVVLYTLAVCGMPGGVMNR